MDIKKVDPRLRPTIIKLNEMGYKTDYSCSGHKGKDGKVSNGYVSILGRHNVDEVKRVARKVGLSRPNVVVRRKKGKPTQRTIIGFQGLGGYSVEGFDGKKSRSK